MKPAPSANMRLLRSATDACCRLKLAALVLAIAGCATTTPNSTPRPALVADTLEFSSPDINVRLIGALQEGDEGTLVEDPGWIEYVVAIRNSGRRTLTVHNLKLLTLDGRYLDSAGSYEQLSSPPDLASQVAGSVATRAAGVAAGQVIPFGGTVVGIISGAVSASAAESKASSKREFDLRKLKVVELAPAGKVTGSAFLPHVTNAKALVVDYGQGEQMERIEIRLPRS